MRFARPASFWCCLALPVIVAGSAAAGGERVILGKTAVVEKEADAYDVRRDILVLNGDGGGLQT